MHESIVEWRTWRQLDDYEKLHTPIERLKHPRTLHPTIESRSLVVPTEQCNHCIDSLAHIQIPVLPAIANAGLDGTSFELFAKRSFTQILLHWWCDLPPEWKPILTWFDETLTDWKARLQDVEPVLVSPPDGELSGPQTFHFHR